MLVLRHSLGIIFITIGLYIMPRNWINDEFREVYFSIAQKIKCTQITGRSLKEIINQTKGEEE